MPFDEFVKWALYDGQTGYYSTARKRIGKIGKQAECDFYTSSTLHPIWGELVVEACVTLLGQHNPADFVFVEIAAEPNDSVLNSITHPFGKHQIIRLGDPVKMPKQAIAYSNEWLDAQPFKRFRFSKESKGWKEIYVLKEKDQLVEIEQPIHPNDENSLPKKGKAGDIFDWPCGARHALRKMLASNSWSGVFLTFDYGLTREVLLRDRPQGTARAYHRQKMETNLLSRPSEQDLTCHLCWEDLEECLEEENFRSIGVKNQESFLLSHSSKRIRQAFEEKLGPHDPKMQALKEILHPAHLGHSLHALWGVRE